MAWTKITRAQYRRDGLRYASDVSDEEWLLIESWLPRARRLGRPRRTCLRSIVNALFYMASSGCAWRLLPADSDETGHAFQSEAGHCFRHEAGQCSDLKPAT